LQELEDFTGVTGNPSAHGTSGPTKVRAAPANAASSGAGNKFVQAIIQSQGVPLIEDHNDPNTPIGAFHRWHLSSFDDGTRCSSSTGMLEDSVRAKRNLDIKVWW